MSKFAGHFRLGRRILTRACLRALAEDYCVSPSSPRPGPGPDHWLESRKQCGRGDRRRWLRREFMPAARVAHDALLEEDRARAVAVLCDVVVLADALLLTLPATRLEDLSTYETEFTQQQAARALGVSISSDVLGALTSSALVPYSDAPIAMLAHEFERVWAFAEQAYASGDPSRATGEQLDVFARMAGITRRRPGQPNGNYMQVMEESDESLRERLRLMYGPALSTRDDVRSHILSQVDGLIGVTLFDGADPHTISMDLSVRAGSSYVGLAARVLDAANEALPAGIGISRIRAHIGMDDWRVLYEGPSVFANYAAEETAAQAAMSYLAAGVVTPEEVSASAWHGITPLPHDDAAMTLEPAGVQFLDPYRLP